MAPAMFRAMINVFLQPMIHKDQNSQAYKKGKPADRQNCLSWEGEGSLPKEER